MTVDSLGVHPAFERFCFWHCRCHHQANSQGAGLVTDRPTMKEDSTGFHRTISIDLT